jgi:putative peptidoglycan lipid II flippase
LTPVGGSQQVTDSNGAGGAGTEPGGVARAAGVIALGNISSRVLGLLRVTLIAGLFGATGLVSAYQIAATVPTMIYDLLVGGMLSSALVPVFSEYAAAKDRGELAHLVSVILTFAVTVMLVVVTLIEILAPQIASLLGAGLSPELQAVTVRSIRIVTIALLFFALSGVVTGTLYTLRRFTYPAFGATAFNAGIIVAAVALSGTLGIYSLAVGVVLGSLVQLTIQLPDLRHLRLAPRFDFSHPGVRRIVKLYLPVLAGLLVSQVQVGIDRNLASQTGEQSIAWMQNATTLIQFPHGLVAVAISLAVLPSLSRFYALKDWGGYRQTLSLGLRMVVMLIVPAVVGLFILSRPIVQLIFEHGRFTPVDTVWTVLALRYYLLGLIFASIDWPLNYAFYARQDTLTPALVGVFSVLVYLGVALWLLPTMGMIGLVLADSMKQCSHAVTMLILTYLRLGGLENRRMILAVVKTVAMSAVMGLAILAVLRWLPAFLVFGKLLNALLLVGGGGGLGAAIYLVCGALLGQEEIVMLWTSARARLSPRN